MGHKSQYNITTRYILLLFPKQTQMHHIHKINRLIDLQDRLLNQAVITYIFG